MKQACYHIEKENFLTAVPCADLADLLAEGEGDYWQEVETATPEELAALVTALGLHPLMVEDILEAGHSTLIDRYSDAVYIEFPVNLNNSEVGIGYLSIIVTQHLIASIPRGMNASVQALAERFELQVRPASARKFAVLYILLDYFIDQNMQIALRLRNRINALEKAFVANPSAKDVSAAADLQQETSALISIAEDQRYCVKALENMRVPVLDFGKHRAYFSDLTNNAEQVLRVLNRAEDRLNSLHSSYQLQMDDASAKRLRMLTVISAIFLPLTLITGFFGMNFQVMGLLDTFFGFWLAVALMAFAMLLMLWYFYRQGWFK